MSVDAMIKHHQAVAEVITHAMSDYASAATGTSWNKACFAFEADAILCALSRAGFRVLGPDDLDEKTVERCVEVAAATDPEKPANWLHRREEIAAAIRSLSSPDHADDLAVDRFAIAMKQKLAKKREEGRGGWENKDECSAEYLSYLLIQHIWKGDPVDIANLAMMLHQRGERIVIDSETSFIIPNHADAGKVDGDGWLPIESAPKDTEEPYLCYSPGNKRAHNEYARYAHYHIDGFSARWPKGRNQYPEAPYTHWRTLPSAPSEGAE